MQPGGVIRFSFPRSDLSVSTAGVTLKPALALGSWVAFKEMSNGQATAMGGLLLTSGNSSILPLTLGFNPSVSQAITTRLNARGSVIRAQLAPGAASSPILYGYENASFPIYFSQAPVFNVQPRDTILAEGRDPAFAQQQERMRAHVILRFHEKADSLLVSGLLVGGDELAGKAAVVDAPVGSGHVVLFGIRPLWRWESQGSFALALNAIANWDHLGF